MPLHTQHQRSGRAGRPAARVFAPLILASWIAAAGAEDRPVGGWLVFHPGEPAGQVLIAEEPPGGTPRIMIVEAWEQVVVVNGAKQVRQVNVLVDLDRVNAQTWKTWIFRTNDLDAARADLERTLKQRLEFVHTHVELTDVQMRKLELAGRGDINRFFDDCDAALNELGQGPPSPETLRDIRERCQVLRSQMLQGLHGEGSLFAKSFHTMLSDEQRRRWEASEGARSHTQPIHRANQPRVLIRPGF
jgi:hypothetical protein